MTEKYILKARTGEDIQVDIDVYNFFKDKEILVHKGYAFVRIHQMFYPDRDDGYVVDHINNTPLDNRRSNLRLVTKRQNARNASFQRNSKVKYKGVTKNKNSYRMRVTERKESGKKVSLYQKEGFKTAEEAARAYDICVLNSFGEYAYTNFKKELYVDLDLKKESMKYKTGHYGRWDEKKDNIPYIGVRVTTNRKKYEARYKDKHLGVFSTMELAAQAYNKALVEDNGDLRKINIIPS